MFLRVFIPRYNLVESSKVETSRGTLVQHKPYYVYQIEVSIYGTYSRLDKRYSQFLSLHQELRHSYRTPEFPPKKLRNTSHKVLEQRRSGLENYIQYFVRMNPVPQVLLNFLDVPREKLTSTLPDEKPSHQQVAGFLKDPFLIPSSGDRLPDIVSEATMEFFYQES
ncbi:hypothetical protein TCAL_03434 [Tigriopus californicus]|uniref:PX domain-containing protein n=1 Tax=Tigriopus californicus TaxID=6832 RepID=A0A553NPR8_TIGCA|nr:sorting nexin-24-like [Tigriopus californicus]TRY67424.1 hypothetical protein TCAL_03434 [Tigriopus californicus]|eukprot:TCALIF_03433-PA protein Name:"Similar to SNX24 Sorting nexin-24 (Homo sapiens)" AED:0.96 eAED:1.00 QI:0/0/0/0.33/1/1/3/0/165